MQSAVKAPSVKAPLVLLGLAIGLALLVSLSNAGPRPVFDAQATIAGAPVPQEADAAIGQLVLARCGGCHGLNMLTQHPQDAAGWSHTVDEMISMGAQVEPQNKPALVAYLAHHFGGN
ncbi:MAG: hypothetical protein ACRD1Y_10385 [Terriglobales bacterium]